MDRVELEGIADIKLDKRPDGIYLIVSKKATTDLLHRNQILSWIENYNIKDLDFPALNMVFQSEKLYIEEKITDNTNIREGDEGLVIEITPDGFMATASLTPPGFEGEKLSTEDINQLLIEAGIVHGVDENAISLILARQQYNRKEIIASATQPEKGKDGSLLYHFQRDQWKRPKMMEDGTVDFHNLDFFEPAYKGQLLVESIMPEPGEPGMTVIGTNIEAATGKNPPPLLPGRFTVINEAEQALYAEINGQIIYHSNGRIEISPVLEILSDVGTATGDIDFNGTIIISGGVNTGYSVSATGDVEVKGSVEGATIVSQGDIVLHRGIQGLEKASLVANGDILLSFAENANIEAGGNIFANSIVNCVVKCFGSLNVEGKQGALVGGKIFVNQEVSVTRLGSPMARKTEIIVGNMPDIVEDIQRMNEEMVELKKEYEQLTVVIEGLIEMRNRDELTTLRRNHLVTSIHQRSYVREQMEEVTIQLNKILPQIKSSSVGIRVAETMYIGVVITIGNYSYYNDEVRGKSHIFVADDKIVIRG